MAKKKKVHHHTPRRRIGAPGGKAHSLNAVLMKTLGVLGGAVGATVIQHQLSNINVKLVSGGQAVAGYLLSHNKHPFVEALGWGIFSGGVIGLGREFHVISGVNEMVSGMMDGGQYELPPMHYQGGVNGMANSAMLSGAINNFQRVADVPYDQGNDNNPGAMGM